MSHSDIELFRRALQQVINNHESAAHKVAEWLRRLEDALDQYHREHTTALLLERRFCCEGCGHEWTLQGAGCPDECPQCHCVIKTVKEV